MIAWEESPRQFKMSKQLDEGKFGEDLARKFLNDPIIKVNHGISHYDDVTQDKSYQDKDTDFIVWKKNGKTFGLEAKVDSHNTGNFYLETSVDYFSMVPDALNEQRVARRYRDGIDPLWHTPGWVYRSGADQILFRSESRPAEQVGTRGLNRRPVRQEWGDGLPGKFNAGFADFPAICRNHKAFLMRLPQPLDMVVS